MQLDVFGVELEEPVGGPPTAGVPGVIGRGEPRLEFLQSYTPLVLLWWRPARRLGKSIPRYQRVSTNVPHWHVGDGGAGRCQPGSQALTAGA